MAVTVHWTFVDHFGRIYLVAEDSGQPHSMLFVLSPIPEPETYATDGSGPDGFYGAAT
jgi:hypothetical protein